MQPPGNPLDQHNRDSLLKAQRLLEKRTKLKELQTELDLELPSWRPSSTDHVARKPVKRQSQLLLGTFRSLQETRSLYATIFTKSHDYHSPQTTSFLFRPTLLSYWKQVKLILARKIDDYIKNRQQAIKNGENMHTPAMPTIEKPDLVQAMKDGVRICPIGK
jgi:hypothetical protein